ncbi:MAG TPA: glycosyltransferase family 2 protein [Bryobacteraceae bacterium]|nr:glycosyltransferase family 2 protein [Bryobacteraceae bacterium]HPT24886.1 glycosyltransferase family 2 protein [Bryobacteraceae bacterium]
MTIGAVIVTWNSGAHIGPCLDALRRHEPRVHVAVVDNASSDNTLTEVESRTGVRLAANPENRGFAAAVNQGVELLEECDLLLVLNPDATLQTNLDAMVREFEDPRTGACGGRLLEASGSPQTGFELRRFPSAAALVFESMGLNRLWPSNPVNRRYRCLDLEATRPCNAEQPAGAFLMIRRKAWQSAGGFDEGFYPVWFEDVDFLKRLAGSGWLIRFTPICSAVHPGGHSVSLLPRHDGVTAWYGSLLRYAVRHCSYAGRAAVCSAVFAAALPRAAVNAAHDHSFCPFLVYGRVMRLALAAGVSGRSAGMKGVDLKPVLPPGVHGYAKLVNSGDRSPH